jgi:hypothetical protein
MPAPRRSAAPTACVAKMPISGARAEPTTVLLAPTDGDSSAEKEYCKRKQKGSGSDAGQKRDGHGKRGRVAGGAGQRVVGACADGAAAVHRPAHEETGPQCAAAAASEPESRPAPAGAEHEKQGRSEGQAARDGPCRGELHRVGCCRDRPG